MNIIPETKLNQVKEILFKTPPSPYSKTKCDGEAKVLGHAVATNNNMNGAIADRLQKANSAWS